MNIKEIIEKVKGNEMMEKFSISQMTSNNNGKTSASGTMGCLICTFSAIGFLWGVFTKQNDVINQAITYTAFGAGLLGYRKSKESTTPSENVTIDPIAETPKVETPVETPAEVPVEAPVKDQPLNS